MGRPGQRLGVCIPQQPYLSGGVECEIAEIGYSGKNTGGDVSGCVEVRQSHQNKKGDAG